MNVIQETTLQSLKIRPDGLALEPLTEIVGFISCAGAPIIAATTARHKALTAVRTGMATKDWKAYLETIPEDELKIIDKIEGYIAADGGSPIIEGDLILRGSGDPGLKRNP